MTLPSALYQAAVDQGEITDDPLQRPILSRLDTLSQQLQQRNQPTFWTRQKARLFPHNQTPPGGLYLWGGVGIGKSFLMDLFFDSLPFERKLRLHFHRFMQHVHQDLARLQGHKNPLQIVARHFSLKAHIICFDEFFVKDIADAMLLGNLLKALFARGVSIVATSNTAPDNLYANGLQRALFLPAIALLKTHCEVIHLQSDADYRLREAQSIGIYLHPETESTHKQLKHYFEIYAHGNIVKNPRLMVLEREIPARQVADDCAWFDCKTLCTSGRSQLDYIALSQRYKVIMLSGVQAFEPNDPNIVHFIHLVDVLYDKQCLLILSATVALSQLYPSGPHSTVFNRTQSRLTHMQTHDYLKRCLAPISS